MASNPKYKSAKIYLKFYFQYTDYGKSFSVSVGNAPSKGKDFV